MLEPIQPPDESERLAALCSLHTLDTPPDERFDRITRIAQRLFDAPIALVTLVDADRQWFKSRMGLDATQTPRDISFCGHAILQSEPFIINDTLKDERFADNPLVTGYPHARFYAGVPIHEARGWRMGTLCIIDHKPRKLTPDQIASLRDLAVWTETELNLYSLKQATAMTREKEARLRSVVDNAGDAIVTVNDEGLIDTFNPAAERMFGVRDKDVIGRPVVTLAARHYRSAISSELASLLRAGVRGGIPINRQVFGQRKNGARFPANLVVSEMNLSGRRGLTGLVRDISERRRSAFQDRRLNRKLAESLALQQAILDSTDYAIVAVNARGQVTLFNAGAQRMLGYAEHEMRHQDQLGVLYDPTDLQARAEQLSIELGRPIRVGPEVFVAKARDGKRDESEWTCICKDGRRLAVSVAITAVWDDQHDLAGFVGIVQDLSARKRVEQLKDEFIATLSHELRTPLTSIRGSIGLLGGGAAGPMPPAAKSLLDVATKNCDRLVLLINDILDVEKIASGTMRFEPAIQPLRPIVEHSVAATHSFASQFQVSFDLRADGGELYVSVDADRLAQVIINLLSNAAKFAPQGDVVEVRVKRRDGKARVSVTDHGIGISDEFRDRIFQKFAQADGADNRKKGGTGLGLNISKSIIEKHHGKLDFTSVPGVSTEFYFDLPLASAPA